MARPLSLSPFQPRQRWVPRCPDPLQLKLQAPVPVMQKWPSLLGEALRIAWKWNVDSWNSKPRQLVERRVKERWKIQITDPLRKATTREVCVCIDIRELWGDVTRDDSQRRFLAQHSVATLLRHCLEWLQHCSNNATLCYAKNRRRDSSRATSPLASTTATAAKTSLLK